jgi:hypothetical protein
MKRTVRDISVVGRNDNEIREEIYRWMNSYKIKALEERKDFIKCRKGLPPPIGLSAPKYFEITLKEANDGILVHTEGFTSVYGMENDFAPDALSGAIPRRKGYELITNLWRSLESMSSGSGAIRSPASSDQSKDNCPNCGAESVGTKFCVQCGEKIPVKDQPPRMETTEPKYSEREKEKGLDSEQSSIPEFCNNCGARTEGKKFCMGCGEKLLKEDSPAPKPTSGPEIPKAIPVIKQDEPEEHKEEPLQEDLDEDKCPNCGSITEGRKFCMSCGEKISKPGISIVSEEPSDVEEEEPTEAEPTEEEKLAKEEVAVEEVSTEEESEVTSEEESELIDEEKGEVDKEEKTVDIDWESEKSEKLEEKEDKSKMDSEKKKLFCPYCGSKTGGKKFCSECGEKLLN